MAAVEIRALNEHDADWAGRFLIERWGSAYVVSRGKSHDTRVLPGFVAEQAGQPVGLVTYRIAGGECEIVTIDSVTQGFGIGSALIDAVKHAARQSGCRRAWLVTTNDNTPAIRFYQKRGFAMAALHRGAIDAARKLKPEIPLIGLDGIPMRDEIEFWIVL